MRGLVAFIITVVLTMLTTWALGTDLLDIADLTAERDPIALYAISGIATSKSERTISSAFAEFNPYEERGTMVGNTV